jgi:hypothetical protein
LNYTGLHTIRVAQSDIGLDPAPINRDWILEGNPTARGRRIYRSADGDAETYIWDCTAGRFNWHYDIDETVFVIEGSVIIEDQSGLVHELTAGGTIFFPSGSTARWYVPTYVRKVAFCRVALTAKMQAARACYRLLKRLVGIGPKRSEAEAMFRVDPAGGER